MGAGATILAPAGNAVTFNNTAIFGCEENDWGGIYMAGSYDPSESLVIEDSYFFNSAYPVHTYEIPHIKIVNSVFVNGRTAIELLSSSGFTVNNNLIGNFSYAGISTNYSNKRHSEITKNKFIDVAYGLLSDSDLHDSLDFLCNEIQFQEYGISSSSTTFKNFGDSITSSGNKFVSLYSETPEHYIDHTGNTPKYYYGPAQSGEFAYVPASGVTLTQAVNNRVCPVVFSSQCPDWMPVGIKEQVKQIAGQLLIYPNPSTGAFNLSYAEGKDEYSLEVYDVLGRLISDKKVNFSTEKTVTFDINSKGLYLVTLKNGNHRITQKVIVE
ncbi:MAG: fungalysin family metalloprotease precursor [Bacteroidetes bacterium]|nr:fungalysin family metalloprotease precursor [Bacteroidota bacterium]